MSVVFDELVAVVHGCRRCPSMDGRRRVLGPGNGSPRARILLVGEAPGRLGAERTGVPFVGDASGRRLDGLLEAAGWRRADVFVTNAVLCNPRDGRDRNRPPSAAELRDCRGHLDATLACVRPRLVVALGRRALAALGAIEPHDLQRSPPGTLAAWRHGSWLTWMVHPSPLAGAQRAWAVQSADWRSLRRRVEPVLR